MKEQSLPHARLSRFLSALLTLAVVAGALVFAFA